MRARPYPVIIIAFAAATLTGCVDLPPVGAPLQAAVANRIDGEAREDADASLERLVLSHMRDAILDGNRMHGAAHELDHFENGYRGRSPSGALFLSEPELGRISGLTGGSVTTLDYETDPASGRISAHGRWALKEFELDVEEDVITVKRRFCSDTYRRRSPNSDVFVGATSCYQSGIYGSYLRVPHAFLRRPAGEQVVFLSAFLL